MSEKKLPKSKLSIAAAATLAGISSQASATEVSPECLDLVVSSDIDVYEEGNEGTLRGAINAINSTGDCGDFHTITFSDAVNSIELDDRIYIGQDVDIQGPGALNLTITAADSYAGDAPHFNMSGADLKMSGITLSGMEKSAVWSNSEITLDDMIISDNEVGYSGAAVHANGDLTISNSALTGNVSSSRGGAIYARGDVTIVDSVISDNYAYSSGAGLYIKTDGDVMITGSSIDNNETSEYVGNSGGLYFRGYSDSSLTISTTSITNNTAGSGDGGGLFLRGSSSGKAMVIENSTISNNTVGDGYVGGGVFMNSGALDINASTIVENNAYSGGGIWNGTSGTITLNHTVLANNTASDSGANLLGRINIAEYSFIGSMDDGFITAKPNSIVDGDDSALGLTALADNGGLGLTHFPEKTSPLVNAGAETSELEVDQLGNARVIGPRTDIGAVEFQAKNKKSSSGSFGAGFIAFFSALALFRRKLK